MTWKEIQEALCGHRERIWHWLLYHGPATTTTIAQGTKIPLLTVRPRVSELALLGWVECVGRVGREGSYQARQAYNVQADHQARTANPQMTLGL